MAAFHKGIRTGNPLNIAMLENSNAEPSFDLLQLSGPPLTPHRLPLQSRRLERHHSLFGHIVPMLERRAPVAGPVWSLKPRPPMPSRHTPKFVGDAGASTKGVRG
jgi:hypothetical protein